MAYLKGLACRLQALASRANEFRQRNMHFGVAFFVYLLISVTLCAVSVPFIYAWISSDQLWGKAFLSALACFVCLRDSIIGTRKPAWKPLPEMSDAFDPIRLGRCPALSAWESRAKARDIVNQVPRMMSRSLLSYSALLLAITLFVYCAVSPLWHLMEMITSALTN